MEFPVGTVTKCYVTQPAFTCSKLTIETLEQGVSSEHISHLVLVFLLLTLNM